MTYRKLKIYLSKCWTLTVCSLSVAVIALMGSCRSKKVNKTAEPDVTEDLSAQEVVEEYLTRGDGERLTPVRVMPGDSQRVQDLIRQTNSLKEEVSGRMRSVIYGTPEIMQRRAQENEAMRNRIDSLDNEINKSRK
ncbi:MAG: hypothetical protein J6W42_09470 [Bacteroidaceae bacterium]|nr:hypothetical protein [Bacteroidaceae bacterium]